MVRIVRKIDMTQSCVILLHFFHILHMSSNLKYVDMFVAKGEGSARLQAS